MLKRMIAITLAAALALTLLPAYAFASDKAQDSGYEQALRQRMAQIPLGGRAGVTAPQTENQRQKLDFNTDWLFIAGNDSSAKEPSYDESRAKRVSLPHAREAYDLYAPDIAKLQTIDWYRRHFTLSEADKGDRVVVDFAGGGQVNRVYVNGALVGEAKGTFTPFSFDITDYVTFGEYDNVIAVQVDSRYHSGEMPPGKSIDFHFFGGLHGSAWLTLTDPLRAASVFYYNDDVASGCASATVHGWIELENDYPQPVQATVRSIIRDMDGAIVSQQQAEVQASSQDTTQVKLDLTIAGPKLWSPDTPYLYTVETQVWANQLLVDSQDTRIGLRTLKATSPSDSVGYFTLNGQRIPIIGGNRHTQVPYLGNAVTDKLSVRDAELLKHDLGINFVRTSHYQTTTAFLDACDRLGIMVEEEPLGWLDTPGWEQFCYSAEEMVKRDRNHASIVLWGIIPNERELNFPSVAAGQERHRVTKALDPSRLTIQEEMNACDVVADVYGWHDYTNPNQANPFKKPAKADSWFVTEWNTNLGKHFIVPNDSESRKINQVEQDGLKLSQLAGNPRIMGTLKWDLFGYMTPQAAYERGKNVDLWRCSGVYGHWRDPLHKTWIAYLLGAQAPNPADVGDILFINSEWKEDSPKSFTVTTNLDAVALYYGTAGGEELIARQNAPTELTTLKNGLFRFDLGARSWSQDSYLLAKGYRIGETTPIKEHKVFASTYPSEKEGAALTLHNTTGDLTADGSDAAWLLAELKDKNGQREFYGDDNVSARILSGPGELVYSDPAPIMADGISGFYLRSAQDEPGETSIHVSVDLGETLNDDDAAITYTGAWTAAANKQDAWKGDYHETTTPGASATITFTGTQLAIYSESRKGGGTAGVAIDGSPAGNFSCSNLEKYETIANYRVWKSPVLEYGTHTVTITAKGAVNIDRLKVFDGKADVESTITVTTLPDTARRVPCRPGLPAAAQPEEQSLLALEILLADAEALDRSMYDPANLAQLDDAVRFAESVRQLPAPTNAIIGKAVQQLSGALTALRELSVTRILHTDKAQPGQTGVYYYAADPDTWALASDSTYANKKRQPGDYYSITFEGVKIALYCRLNDTHGLADIYLDDTLVAPGVDLSRSPEENRALIWESGVLESGTHTVKVVVTGISGAYTVGGNACVSFGEAVVYKEIDPVQEAKTELAAAMARADILDRPQYTTDSLEPVDQALIAAETVLRSPAATVAEIEAAQAALEQAMAGLQPEQQSDLTVTCLENDKTTVPGTLHKVYYKSKDPTNWVLEFADTQDKNRYLKKIATSQTPAPYAEISFEGVGIEIFSRCSKTSGYAWVQVLDDQGTEVDSQRNISLYSLQPQAGKSIYRLAGQPRGRYVLRLYPEHKAADENAGTDLTSINLAYAVIATGQGGQSTPDTAALDLAVAGLNSTSLDGRHAQIKSSFAANVIQLVNGSYGLLEGIWPNISLADPLPQGATATRIKAVCDKITDILAAVNQELTVESAGPLANINVPFGTPLEDIGLPAQVTVLSSDQQREKLPVTWSCADYDGGTPGPYPFEGVLTIPEGMTNRKDVKAHLTVTVAQPDEKLYGINVTIEGGQAEVAVPSQAAAGSEVTLEIGPLPQSLLFDSISAVYTPEELPGHHLLSPEPAASLDQRPTEEPGHKPDSKPTDELTDEPASEPTDGTTSEPTSEPTDEPTGEPADEPTGEPADGTTNESADEPNNEPIGGPTDEPASEPTVEPVRSRRATSPGNIPVRSLAASLGRHPARSLITTTSLTESPDDPPEGPAPEPNADLPPEPDQEPGELAEAEPSAEPAGEPAEAPSRELTQEALEANPQALPTDPLKLTVVTEGRLYRFLMPAGPVEITVRFKEAPTPPGQEDQDDHDDDNGGTDDGPQKPSTPGSSDDDRDEPSAPAPSDPVAVPAPAVLPQQTVPKPSPEHTPLPSSPAPEPEAPPEQGQAPSQPDNGPNEGLPEEPDKTPASTNREETASSLPLVGIAASAALAGACFFFWYRKKQ